jgi:signal transduction histidine kinase/DNA-binding response OmpR family regulator/methyl-accepting chemotaxis protein
LGFDKAQEASQALMKTKDRDMVDNLSTEIEGFISSVPRDLDFLANSTSFAKYTIWDSIDEKNSADVKRLDAIQTFLSFSNSKKYYYKIRFIGLDGYEKINVLYSNREAKSLDKFQNRSEKEYFKIPYSYKTDKLYISELNLNREHGRVSVPYIPVVRFAKPVIDSSGTNYGVFVLSLYAEEFLKDLRKRQKAILKDARSLYLVDSGGFYLFSSEKEKLWGKDLGHNISLEGENPELFSAVTASDSGTFEDDNYLYTFNRIYLSKRDKSKYWTIFSVVDKSVVLKDLNEFKALFFFSLLLVMFLVLILIYRYVYKITEPLNRVSKQLSILSLGGISKIEIDYKRDDEVGKIVHFSATLLESFAKTIAQAKSVANGDYTKSIELLSKKDALGEAINNMTKTLRDTSAVAESIAGGDLSQRVEVKSSSDRLAISMNKMVDTLSDTARQANSISEGNYDMVIEIKNEKDVLGKALVNMVNSLREVSAVAQKLSENNFESKVSVKSDKDLLSISINRMVDRLKENFYISQKQQWLRDSTAKFSATLLGNYTSDEICSKAITFVCKELNAGVGIIYVYEKELLKERASYAYLHRSELNNSFKLGEGIVGQVALNRSEIILENRQVIKSAFAQTPAHSYTYPLLFQDILYGVVELGIDGVLDSYQKQFIDNANHLVASSLSYAIQNQKVEKLLSDTQESNRVLTLQKEEIEQSSKKMQEQQEQLEEANSQMQEQQLQLKASEKELLRKNENLELASKELQESSEELKLSSKYKSEFLANMSHELRTPLNSIILLSDMLKDNLKDNELKKVSIINSSGKELLRLINDVLDLSKVEAGKMELVVDRVHSSVISENIVDMFSFQAEQKGINFRVIDEYRDYVVNDSDKILQVLRNLLSNSLKFTERGEISVTIKKSKDVEFIVKDTGIGIPEEKQKRIFEAFQQADGGTSRKYGGTGLGLSISRELAKLMKGKIALNSAEREGSSFSLTLPNLVVQESDSESIEKIESVENIEKKSIEKDVEKKSEDNSSIDDRDSIIPLDRVFLIVEDDERFALTLKEIVNSKGDLALIALTAKEALTISKSYKNIEGILLDLGLPDMDGVDLLKELKNDLKTRNIPVYIITGRDDEKETALRALGASGCRKKPIDRSDVQSIIDTIKSHKVKKLLIVEDNDIQRDAMVEFISDSGLDIEAVSSVDGAIETLEAREYDAIILDLTLQEEADGLQVCQFLKENSILTPVIIYTGKELTTKEELVIREYTDSIVIKSVNSQNRLLDEVDMFLNRVRFENVKSVDTKNISFKNRCFLAVDDDIRNIYIISELLSEAEVLTASNGAEAIEVLEENRDKIELILMDIMMPVMNGYEAIEQIRKRGIETPIVVLSAKAMSEDIDKSIKLGANAHITKPIDLNRLMGVIGSWIK